MRYSTHSHRRPHARYGANGFTLVEVLIGAALLLFISIAILPLFMRSLDNNTSGGRSTTMTSLATSDLEEINQSILDHVDYQLTADLVTDLGTEFYDVGSTGVGSDNPANDAKIGDEKWVDAVADADGMVLWSRNLKLRRYSYGDIHVGTVTLAGDTVETKGNPEILDTPLPMNEEAHFSEFRVSVRPNRQGLPLSLGQRMTVGHYRVF